MFWGHNTIVYEFFYTRMDSTKIFVMPLEFAGIKNTDHMSIGMIIQDALSPSNAVFFLFISDEATYQNNSLCLILDVDGWFIYFFA